MTLKAIRRLLYALALFLLVAIAWVGFRAHQVQSDLRAADDDATQLQAAVTADDQAGSATALDNLRTHSGAAARETAGPTWRLLTHLPVFGDDAHGVQTVSQVVSDVARDALPALIQSSGRIDQLTPRDGRIDLGALASLRAPVTNGAEVFDSATHRLDAVDSAGFIGPLRDRYDGLARRVRTVAHQLTDAQTALQVMPEMLGAKGPKNFLLVVQNNAEVRATGGLPGSVSLLHTQAGKVTLTKQVAGADLTAPTGHEIAVTPAERAIFHTQLGTFFQDANFTPDFPRAAELMKAHWEASEPERVDGVLTLDPVALSYILGVVGPVTIGDQTITEDNAVEELLHGVYVRVSDPAAQDMFFEQVAQAVFERVTAGAPSPRGLLRALTRGVAEHRLAVHSFDHVLQAHLSGLSVAHALVVDPKAGPQVGFYVNDATGAKMSYYLRYGATVNATSCSGGVQQLTAKAFLQSDAPKDAASLPFYVTGGGEYGTAPGDQLDTVLIYGPVGGTIKDMNVSGKSIKFDLYHQYGRPVAEFVVGTQPQQRVEIEWTMTTGHGQTGDTRLAVTPGIAQTDLSTTARTAC